MSKKDWKMLPLKGLMCFLLLNVMIILFPQVAMAEDTTAEDADVIVYDTMSEEAIAKGESINYYYGDNSGELYPGITYDKATHTLTLTRVKNSGLQIGSVGIGVDEIVINLVGENKIGVLMVTRKIRIEGTGSLWVNAPYTGKSDKGYDINNRPLYQSPVSLNAYLTGTQCQIGKDATVYLYRITDGNDDDETAPPSTIFEVCSNDKTQIDTIFAECEELVTYEGKVSEQLAWAQRLWRYTPARGGSSEEKLWYYCLTTNDKITFYPEGGEYVPDALDKAVKDVAVGKTENKSETTDKTAAATPKTITNAYFSVTIPAGWDGKYTTYTDSTVNDHSLIGLYSKKCYDETKGQAGWLFSIAAYTDESYKELPAYEILKKSGGQTYVYIEPTDVQTEGVSQKAKEEYAELLKEAKVISNSLTTAEVPKKPTIKSVKNQKGKKAKITLKKKVSGVNGYEYEYSTSKKFKSYKDKYAKKTTLTVKKLKKNKKYYLRARTYKTVDGMKIYSVWSNVKSVKIKK